MFPAIAYSERMEDSEALETVPDFRDSGHKQTRFQSDFLKYRRYSFLGVVQDLL